ncbi:hypothetical protein ASG17_12770 [Brevundimonas sp. Leaf363]|nr:hypothetical protein ASG17_12770 [Brevundimonas sp. Leaf363]
MLEHFFRHYDWVDRFFILDDSSTDGSREYLESRDDVEVKTLVKANPDSWVDSARQIYNSCWKASRGLADWVVITNIDEHLYHPDMRAYLARASQNGVTAIPALGYQMICDSKPNLQSLLSRDHRMGCPWRNMGRLAIFNPAEIEETNFKQGRHRADFTGHVVLPAADDVINLHYKYMGEAETHARHRAQGERLGDIDRERGWGHKYGWDAAALSDDFAKFRRGAVDVLTVEHASEYNEPRWWRERTWPTKGTG